MASRQILRIISLCILPAVQIYSQSATDMAVLKGLSPVTILYKSNAGNAALGANFVVTGGIQSGVITQPTLLQFSEQQQQALKDIFMTTGNLAQLADGLGTSLGAAYVARAHYINRDSFTNISQSIADLIAYTIATTSGNANSGKYFFANKTTNGKKPVPDSVAAILTKIDGVPDMFGRAYGLRAGSPGADSIGNSRPFQTEPGLTRITGLDYFYSPADNIVYNRGPMMNLTNSPSYPSGHTTYGYTGALLLAILIPERYSQMITRGAEYGNDRIIAGAHYAMDVLGARTLALYDLAHLLANDPLYIDQTFSKNIPLIKDFQAAVKLARADIVAALEKGCSNTIAVSALEDIGRFSNASANDVFYEATQTYNLPVVYLKNAGVQEDVGKLAPEAGYLLTAAFPSLTLEQANKILTETQGPGGGFLDDGSPFGVYSRLNLYAASKRAAQIIASK